MPAACRSSELTLRDLRTAPPIDVIDEVNQDPILNWLAPGWPREKGRAAAAGVTATAADGAIR
jgi:hypothetical protein